MTSEVVSESQLPDAQRKLYLKALAAAEQANNGYAITFGDIRVYVAGDTENIPEMKNLKNIDYAFLPMNLPYTMTPEMVADAAKAFKPKVLYPYHFGNTNTSDLEALMKDTPGVEVRVRNMK